MTSIKERLKKLEKKIYRKTAYPSVVEQAEDELLENAMIRALGSLPYKSNWRFIIVPQKLSEAEWEFRYSPKEEVE
tara:strand:+ start:724 stop:951 length:228 start_codon:yes stop_codon:yes gene_type:complete